MTAATPTALLKSWRGGDREALDRLMPLLYDELSRIAHGAMSGERRDHTLQTRALVHEAYLRLIDADIAWQDRAHFLALAARAMRRILTDHARKRHGDKRGGDQVRVALTDIAAAPAPDSAIDFLGLDEAMDPPRGAGRAQGARPRAALLRRPQLRGNRRGPRHLGGDRRSRLRLAKLRLRRELKRD